MSRALADGATSQAFGDLLRYWRGVRRRSQLDVASVAETTPRHVSFVETGRSQPSREMILRLARALDVPLRDRNGLLVAAGYAPLYPLEPLGAPSMAAVDSAVKTILNQHDPFPAIVMDRSWQVLRANDGAFDLFSRLFAPEPIPDPANVLRLMIEPGPVQRSVLNRADVVPALLERARREAVGGVLDAATADLVAELSELPEVAGVLNRAGRDVLAGPVVDVQFVVDGSRSASSPWSPRSAHRLTSQPRSCGWRRSSRTTSRRGSRGVSFADCDVGDGDEGSAPIRGVYRQCAVYRSR